MLPTEETLNLYIPDKAIKVPLLASELLPVYSCYFCSGLLYEYPQSVEISLLRFAFHSLSSEKEGGKIHMLLKLQLPMFSQPMTKEHVTVMKYWDNNKIYHGKNSITNDNPSMNNHKSLNIYKKNIPS